MNRIKIKTKIKILVTNFQGLSTQNRTIYELKNAVKTSYENCIQDYRNRLIFSSFPYSLMFFYENILMRIIIRYRRT